MLRQAVLWLMSLAAIALGPGVVCTWADAITLDLGTYHIGNGDFSGTTDRDIVAQNAVVGPKWSIAFAADRPILCSVRIEMLYGVGGGMPDYAESGTVTIDNCHVGTIRPSDNRRTWRSSDFSLGHATACSIVTIHSCKWQGDYDDFVFRSVILDYTPAHARVSVIGEGQVLQEEEQYTGTAYVGPHQGIRIDALLDGGALQWGPAWKVIHCGNQMLFMRTDGRAGVVIPLVHSIDPFVQTPSGVGLLADSTARQWRQVEAPWSWPIVQGQQPTDYVNPTPCWLGGVWNVTFHQDGQNRWMKLTQQDRSLWLGSDGHITYFDPSNSGGYCFTQ